MESRERMVNRPGSTGCQSQPMLQGTRVGELMQLMMGLKGHTVESNSLITRMRGPKRSEWGRYSGRLMGETEYASDSDSLRDWGFGAPWLSQGEMTQAMGNRAGTIRSSRHHTFVCPGG